MGRGKVQNIFGTYLCRQSTLVLESQPHLFIFNLVKFGAFFELFGPFGAISWVGVRFKKIIAIYLNRQPTLVLEVQPYLFVFNLATFGAFFALFWALWGYFLVFWGLFFESGSGSKTFLEPTYVVNQLWFWKYNPTFLFLIRLNLGALLHFWGLSGLFLGLGSG